MNTEELRKEAAEKYAKGIAKYGSLDSYAFTNREVNQIASDNSHLGFEAGAEWEAERENKWIDLLIAKYEDKIKSVENLINPPMGRGWGDAPSHSDIERLKARIYERKEFIKDLKSLLTPPKTSKQ